jgi:hypothetical protein
MARLVAIATLRPRRDCHYRLVLPAVLLAHLLQRSILCNWRRLHLFISVLVLSEINYPGWVATIDGAKAPIDATDFLLRGCAAGWCASS